MNCISKRLQEWWHSYMRPLFYFLLPCHKRQRITSGTERTNTNTKVIKANISLCKPKCEPFLFDNGKITISDDSIVVSACLDSEHADMLSVAYKYGIGLQHDFVNYAKYKKADEGGKPIKITREDETRLLSPFRTKSIANSGSEYTWSLSKLSFSYSSTTGENFVVINLPYIQIVRGIRGLANLQEPIILSDNIHSLIIRKASNENQTIINTDNLPQTVLDTFLTHASFYFYSLCDIIKCYSYNDGQQKVKIQIPTFENAKGFGELPELHYVNYSECRSFKSFFQQSKWNTLQEDERVKLKNAVYTLSRCKYCDETTEFLLLYSILDRYVGNSYGTKPYPVMREKLAERNIDIEKIGYETDSTLQKLQLNLIRDNYQVVGVTNFCNLRNYIMHFTANAKIDEFLRKYPLISNMRFAVTVILLQEFGFGNIYFPKDWSHLSVLLHNREE